MADNNLQIVISAVNKSQAQMNEVTKQLNGITNATKSTTASVFQGVASWDLLKKSISVATEFITSSVQASMEASKVMAQVETNVTNAGMSFAKLTPQLKEYGESALKLGIDDEQAMSSLSRFLIVTKDFSQARATANLAMDLASAKDGDLESSTKAVLLVLQGNTRALKEYGVDGNTTAEVLINAQEKVKNSTINQSQTSAGQLRILKVQWDNIKESVGDKLLVPLQNLFLEIQNNQATIEGFATGLVGLAEGAGWVAKQFVGTGKAIAYTIANAQEYFAKHSRASEATAEDIAVYEQTTIEAGKALVEFYDGVDETGKSTKKTLEEQKKEWADQAKVLADIINKQAEAEKSVTDYANAIEEASKEYKNLNDVSSSALTDLKADHIDASKSIQKEIDDVNKSLKSLASTYRNDLASALDSYTGSSESNTQSVAEAIVANQDAISKLQGDIAGGNLSKEDRIKAQEELAQRQQAEQDNATLITSLSTQIAEIKAFNSMSELNQAIATYNSKQALAQQEYDANVARITKEYNEKKKALKQELSDIKEKQSNEQKLYESKVKYITDAQLRGLQISKDFATANLKVTEAQIKSEIAYYNQLASAVQNAKSGNQTRFSLISNDINKIKAPEVGKNGVTININTMVGQREFAEEMGNEIIKTLQLQAQM